MTFATDYKRNIQPGEAYERFLTGLSGMDKVLADNNMKRAFNLADIKAAHKKHRPIVIQWVEGCHFLEVNWNVYQRLTIWSCGISDCCTTVMLLCHWAMYIRILRSLAGLLILVAKESLCEQLCNTGQYAFLSKNLATSFTARFSFAITLPL